jgi:hypothetical protein
MPLDAPVTIATLFNSLLIFVIVVGPFFETACQQSILHPERIVGNPEVIPRNVGEERALPPQNNSVKTIVIARAEPSPGSGKRLKLSQLVWLRGTEKLLKQKTRAA